MASPILVTAHLLGHLAGGDAPKLDAILECGIARLRGKSADMAGFKIGRDADVLSLPDVPIPIPCKHLGGVRVARCSDPIAVAEVDGVEYIGRRLDPANADLFAPIALRKISTSGGEHKSYRLPVRRRLVPKVCWFAVGKPGEVLGALKRIDSIGDGRSIGYGRVERWEAVAVAEDYSWFAPHPQTGEPMLMRTLPVGPWLPGGLIGARVDYMAVRSPYWHPGRRTEVVTPC